MSPSTSLRAAIKYRPAGTTFCLQTGVYHITSTIVPKSYDVLWGVPGATVLTGDGVTNQALKGSATYQRGVALRGLVIKRFTGTAVTMGNGWTVQNTRVTANSDIGLFLQDGAVVLDSRFDHNVGYGIGGYGLGNILVARNEIAFNNTRHLTGGASGGMKILRSTGVTVRDNYIHDNYWHGLHCDTDCLHVTFQGNVVESNTGSGVVYEKGFTGLIKGNVVAGNSSYFADRGIHYGGNIRVNTSQGVEIAGNIVEATVPGTNGLSMVDQNRGSGPLGTYKLANDYVHGNLVRLLVGSENGLVGDVHDPTHANNRFVGNTYFVPALSNAYFAWCQHPLPWRTWATLGQDLTGTLAQA